MEAENVVEEWGQVAAELRGLEAEYKRYLEMTENVVKQQKECSEKLKQCSSRMKRLGETCKSAKEDVSGDEKARFEHVLSKIEEKQDFLTCVDEILPKTNGVYLRVILGQINVSILNKAARYKYKEEYEHFKLVLTLITCLVSIILMFVQYRAIDASFHFLLVWYYCTLTIREHILMINGSRVKGWWVAHHFVSTACSGILLIWPDGVSYRIFRSQFVWFSLFLSIVQFLQYYYQQGCIYRLKALGERRDMDVTAEGFQTWMLRGLSFLLPFLFAVYFFQLYNAYTLYQISLHPECIEWQVPVLSVIFLVLFLGNTITTVHVTSGKLRQKASVLKYRLQKYVSSANVRDPSADNTPDPEDKKLQ